MINILVNMLIIFIIECYNYYGDNMKYKKILLVIIISIVLIPISINAKTITIINIAPVEIVEAGDIIEFNGIGYKLYIDNDVPEPGCYGGPETYCNRQYAVTERMIIGGHNLTDSEYQPLYFYKLSANEEPLTYNDFTEDGFYKSGDLIKFETNNYYGVFYIYDENHNIISGLDFNYRNPKVYRLPKLNNKDIYWKVESVINPTVYDTFKNLHFTPFEYTEPKLELKCNKDSIKYGEKANCELCLECIHNINNLNFSLNQKDLKFSNLKYSSSINNIGDNNRIQLSINDENICNEKKTIMTFDVEATKDDTYLDKITLNDIEYVDEIVQAKYEDLDSDLNIISNKPSTNPKTGTELLFIMLPFIVLIIIGTIYTLKTKKKTT